MTNHNVQVLRDAADLIEAAPKLAKGAFKAPLALLGEDGRVKQEWAGSIGEFENTVEAGPKCYCTGGAINAVKGQLDAYKVLADFLGMPADENYSWASRVESWVFGWNDQPSRTKEEVVQALRAAADDEERKGK